ncbi:MAG: hypothetical protein QM756_46050 [Polyangiaceae bacterium]
MKHFCWAALLCACGAPALQEDLFTLDMAQARYPVMLSRGEGCAARPLSAQSGTLSDSSEYHWHEAWSVHSAVAQLDSQVELGDRWLQVERLKYSASDVSTLGARNDERLLRIEAAACR